MLKILGTGVFLASIALGTLAAGPVAGVCGPGAARQATRCAGPEPPLVDDLLVVQAPDLPEPPARAPFRDPVFGRCVTRLTDRAADIAQGDPSQGLKNEYSRVQSFNADESLILIRSTEAYWYIYRADTLQPLGATALQGSVDPRWDATDPNLLYYVDGTRLMVLLVATGERAIQHDFAPDLPGMSPEIVWTRYEGSPSLDGRYWGLMAQDARSRTLAFLVYDRVGDTVVAKRDVRGTPGIDDVDSVTISPLGNFFVAQFGYCPEGSLGTDAQPCGLMVYGQNLQNGRGLVRNIGHSDLAIDAQGREVMVYQQLDTDHLSVVDLETGVSTDLWPIDFSHTPMGFHISGRGYRLPGWALVSTHDGDAASHTWMDDELFAMELRPEGRIVRLAHTHSIVDQSSGQDYFAEPQASANRDFTRLLFTTNWGRTGTQQVETYLVELEPGWDGACRIECSATVPATAKVGTPAAFGAEATASDCQGAVTFAWSFGDGSADSHEQGPSHAYTQAGTYAWALTASADQRTCVRQGTIQASASGTCSLACSAAGPSQATVGQEVTFSCTATPTGCEGSLSWDWDFGDGSAHGSGASPAHAYASAGTYSWRVTVSIEGVTCTHGGDLLVRPAAPPITILGVAALRAPFRLKISGSEFQEGVRVYIGGDPEPWPNVTRKSANLLVLKGGTSLKARFAAGQPVAILIVNPDGGSAVTTFTR